MVKTTIQTFFSLFLVFSVFPASLNNISALATDQQRSCDLMIWVPRTWFGPEAWASLVVSAFCGGRLLLRYGAYTSSSDFKKKTTKTKRGTREIQSWIHRTLEGSEQGLPFPQTATAVEGKSSFYFDFYFYFRLRGDPGGNQRRQSYRLAFEL